MKMSSSVTSQTIPRPTDQLFMNIHEYQLKPPSLPRNPLFAFLSDSIIPQPNSGVPVPVKLNIKPLKILEVVSGMVGIPGAVCK